MTASTLHVIGDAMMLFGIFGMTVVTLRAAWRISWWAALATTSILSAVFGMLIRL